MIHLFVILSLQSANALGNEKPSDDTSLELQMHYANGVGRHVRATHG
jgi:hypothetical protein